MELMVLEGVEERRLGLWLASVRSPALVAAATTRPTCSCLARTNAHLHHHRCLVTTFQVPTAGKPCARPRNDYKADVYHDDNFLHFSLSNLKNATGRFGPLPQPFLALLGVLGLDDDLIDASHDTPEAACVQP